MQVIVHAGETPDLFSEMFLWIICNKKPQKRQGQSDQPIDFQCLPLFFQALSEGLRMMKNQKNLEND